MRLPREGDAVTETQTRTRTRRPSPDLPEHTVYRDEGCPDLGIPSCLACMLPFCRYEMAPGLARRWLRVETLAAHLAAGRTMEDAAALMGISRRSAYRLRVTLRKQGRIRG